MIIKHIARAMRTLPKKSALAKASIYCCASVCVLGAAVYLEHVLLKNWQSYVKVRAIKRIAFCSMLAQGRNNYQRYRWGSTDCLAVSGCRGSDAAGALLRAAATQCVTRLLWHLAATRCTGRGQGDRLIGGFSAVVRPRTTSHFSL
jgi:hypothetical protein